MEINIERDGIRNTDEATALIYYGRYPVNSWAELYYAAVKTLYIEYPDVINSLVSKDSTRALYLRTTTIDMKRPARIATILYLDVERTPLEIVKALREIFRNARVVNINMSIEIRRTNTIAENVKNSMPQIQNAPQISKIPPIQSNPSTVSPIIPIPQFTNLNKSNSLPPLKPSLEVPSFMKSKSDSIIKLSSKEIYIENMKNLVRKYPKIMKREAGKFLNKRRVTLAESSYRYFIEALEIGEGLSIELFFNDEDLKKNIEYYLNITKEMQN